MLSEEFFCLSKKKELLRQIFWLFNGSNKGNGAPHTWFEMEFLDILLETLRLACFDYQCTFTLFLEFEGLEVLPPIFLISEGKKMHSFTSL